MTTPDASSHSISSSHRTWRLLAAGGIILCSGIAIGFGLGARWVRQGDPLGFIEPDKAPARLADMVAWQLGATGAQRDQILAIFESKRDRIDRARLKAYPEIQEILDEVRREVGGVLTTKQAMLWNERFEQLRERWRPRSITQPTP